MPLEPAAFGGVSVHTLPRDEFVNRFKYKTGEHVTILGHTQSGKTTLGFQLLQRVATPKLPALVLVMKPRDPTVEFWAKEIGLSRTATWPPPGRFFRKWWGARPNGHVLWPHHTFDLDGNDDQTLYREFRAGMMHSYKKGDRIVVADEAGGLAKELNLDRALRTLLMRGSSMGCGCWEFSQRPVDMPVLGYSSANHLLMAHDRDKRNRERLRELGGREDPMELDRIVANLPPYHFLYLHQDGGKLVVLP
jgi:hypothetical protein